MNTNLNFTIVRDNRNINFKNIPCVRGTTSGYVFIAGVSKIIRQFLKQRYPQIKFSVRSNKSAIDVYVQQSENLDDELLREIQRELSMFQSGKFNGMTDSYDYKDKSTIPTIIKDGVSYSVSVRYVTVHNHPKWGSKEWTEWMIKNETTVGH